ncbi:hypothetical protein ACFVYR_32165 [Streptomyces sp. NPDC058284]|uniref:hypothetical protein n=1 Tax=unclassified Streptomyces TaxID=2593676 RepID=UPI00364D60AF
MRTKLAATGLALLLGIGGLALAPAAGATTVAPEHQASLTAAPGFYAGGTWQLVQSNSTTTTLNVTQDDNGRLFGTASYSNVVGTIENGSVDGPNISFTIGWSNGLRGRYTGSLGFDRRLSGTTFDLTHPGSQATWFTPRTF